MVLEGVVNIVSHKCDRPTAIHNASRRNCTRDGPSMHKRLACTTAIAECRSKCLHLYVILLEQSSNSALGRFPTFSVFEPIKYIWFSLRLTIFEFSVTPPKSLRPQPMQPINHMTIKRKNHNLKKSNLRELQRTRNKRKSLKWNVASLVGWDIDHMHMITLIWHVVEVETEVMFYDDFLFVLCVTTCSKLVTSANI